MAQSTATMPIETQRLTTQHVKVGEPLPGDVYDDTGRLLLSAGYVIGSQPQLETLLARGMYVDVRTFNACFNHPASAASAERPKFDPFLLRDSIKKRLNRALRGLGREAEALTQLRELSAAAQELAATSAQGAIAAGILDADESYPIRHSVLSALLCELVAAALEWPADKRTSLVGAALSMNAAMLDLQHRLASHEGPLAPAHQAQVRAHPEAAVELLRNAGLTDAFWLDAVLQHHERGGGGGYPRGLAEPGAASQLIRLADSFGALIAPRGDRKALLPPMAIRALLAQESGGPAAPLAGMLVKVLGIYPAGTFVRLANNEQAVVVRQGAAAGAPLVASLTNATGNPYMKPVPRDTQRKEWAVTGLVPRDKVAVGYDLGTLWVVAR